MRRAREATAGAGPIAGAAAPPRLPPPVSWTSAALVALALCASACARDGDRAALDPHLGSDSPVAEAPAAPAEPAPPPPPVEREWPPEELRPGGAVAAEIGPGEVHRWRLPLAGGELVRLVVEQHGVDVQLTWLDPSAAALLTADRIINAHGPELVLAIAEAAGEYVLEIGALPDSPAGRYEATIATLGPPGPAERLGARTYRRFLEAEGLPRAEAAAVREECLEVWRRLGEEQLAGEVLYRMAGDHFLHSEHAEAARRARRAAESFARAGDRRWQGLALNRVGANLSSVGEAGATERAVEEYRAAAAIGREVGDPQLEAAALQGLGQAYRRLGEVQEALHHLEAALAVLPEKGTIDHAQTLHNLGVLHSLYFHDFRRGEELLAAARDSWPEWDPAHARRKATSLNQLGRLALERGDLAGARRGFEAALALHEGDACGRAVVLGRLALIEEAGGRRRRADARRDQAQEIVTREACPRSQPSVDLLAARLAEGRGDLDAALASFAAAVARAEALADRTTLAEALVGVARVRRARGEPDAALAASGRALALAEAVRPTVLREDLRTAFFSTVQDRFDLHVGLLSEAGRHAEAWAAAEAARSRALQDLLAEAGAGLRQGADPRLLAREASLERRLAFTVARRQEEREPDEAVLQGLRHEIDGLIADLERVRAEVRRANPGYAALTRPRPLSVAEVQRDLLDDDTLLLAVRLGEEASWLWAIGRDSFDAHLLPPRAEIEPLAIEVAGWQRSLEWAGHNPPAVCELSRRLLAPVAARLRSQRLVLVLDGALESVAFAALPHPTAASCPEAPPLVARHEVVHLSSAAMLAAHRVQLAGRPVAAGGVAVVADPVYGRDDPRLRRLRPTALAASPAEGDHLAFRRLPHAGREAAAIRALAPGRVRVATGVEASKEVVTGGSLSRHRVLHFAVHGVLDPEQPLLSHLVLSRLDGAGEPVEARLHAHEIYALDLPAELVVLSACDTAIGRQVAGEGMVAGLPRAFLYAGAARVMVSLWQVPDRSTADLMEAFYRRLLLHDEPPGRALQGAQQELWRAGRPPRQWAGWMLQGDWRPLPPFAAPR